ncbi:hypothetical protein [Streptomyces sp. NPDC001388]|uniref:hypothetical protein n=1 Tax=unclassified Streptomyces TaxID=2593676 RepID=UPI003692B7B1
MGERLGQGDLAAAMREAATLRACDIGSVSPTPDGAVVETTRGFVPVGSGGGEGLLRLSVGIPDFLLGDRLNG